MTSKPDFKVMILVLVFMQLTRDLFAIAKFLFLNSQHNNDHACYKISLKLTKEVGNVTALVFITLIWAPKIWAPDSCVPRRNAWVELGASTCYSQSSESHLHLHDVVIR